MKQNNTKKTCVFRTVPCAGAGAALLTGQIQTFGQMLAPMHLPVLLCGFVCGPVWGCRGRCGAAAQPSVRHAANVPHCRGHGFELAAYGLFTGLFTACFQPGSPAAQAKNGARCMPRWCSACCWAAWCGAVDVPFDGRSGGASAWRPLWRALSARPGWAFWCSWWPCRLLYMRWSAQAMPRTAEA